MLGRDLPTTDIYTYSQRGRGGVELQKMPLNKFCSKELRDAMIMNALASSFLYGANFKGIYKL